MHSKEQIIEKLIDKTKVTLENMLKRLFFNVLRLRIQRERRIMLEYVSRQNHNKLSIFLNCDKFQYDDKVSHVNQDRQIQPQNHRFTCSTIRNTKQGRTSVQICQDYNKDLGKISSSSVHSLSNMKNSIIPSQISIRQSPSGLIPLWAQGWIQENRNQDEEEFANRVRERKTKRQIFKTKFQQTQLLKRRAIVKPKENQEKPKPKTKKDKFNYIQHFVDMEIALHQSIQENLKQKQKVTNNIFRGVRLKNKAQYKSLKNSPVKSVNQRHLLYTTRKWQPLVSQSRQLVLKDPEDIKLSSGVTIRQSISKPNNSSNYSASLHHSNSNTTRKKIQLLKNSQGKPLPLRFNQLMSYKRLGSMTHLAYCSSMKTVKDLKEMTETNISIDSKQFVTDEADSKTLIKIANRRVFEELMLQEGIEGSRKSKIRLKKEGRVRFDNVERI